DLLRDLERPFGPRGFGRRLPRDLGAAAFGGLRVACGARLGDTIVDGTLPTLLLHVLVAKRALSRELVVSAATQSNVLDRRFASEREFVRVIEFEEGSRRASLPVAADERASTAVALA